MIPILYDKTGEKKLGELVNCIKCLVEEERNGIFELTAIYPNNDGMLDFLEKENIIVVDANDYLKAQKFRIHKTRKLMNNRIEINARHISFDLAYDYVENISITNQPCEYVLNTLFRNSQFSQHYRGFSNIVMTSDYSQEKTNIIEAIGGTSGSIIDTYGTGAEILRDNTNIHVLNRRGHNNDVTIEYRKNLTGLTVVEETTDLVTRIIPFAVVTDKNGIETEVKGDVVDSPYIGNYSHPYVKYVDYSEEFDDKNVPTKAKLNSLALKEYNRKKVDLPKLNYKIEFIPLSKCAGYEGLEDRINLCDTITVRDTRYNIDTTAKVIKVVYNVLRNRYESMELGEPKTSLGDVIGGHSDALQGPVGPQGPQGPQGPAGADGNIENFPDTLPKTPTITTKVYGFASIEVSWTFENKLYYSYELYASKTKGFKPNTANLLFSGQASTFLHQVKPKETWYYRVCAVNSHGNRTAFSDEKTVNTVKVSELSNYVENQAIGDALIGTLNLDRGWVGELHGNYIDAKQLSVTDGNGKRTLDIDSFGNVNLDVTELKINAKDVITKEEVDETLDEYSTTAEMNSAIKVAKEEINLGVSSTYETKTGVNSKINAIEVGGTNLVLQSPTLNNQFNQLGTYQGIRTVVEDSTARSGKHVEFVCRNAGPGFYLVLWRGDDSCIGKKYTWSFYAKMNKAKRLNSIGHERGGRTSINVTTEWQKFTHTWTYSASGNSAFTFYPFFEVGDILYIKDFKIEMGTKPTDWSPAPEDVQTSIETTKTEVKQYTDSQIKVAKDSITQSVASTYETKTEVESKVNDVKSSVTNLESRVNKAEQKITDSAIISTVQSTINTAKQEAIDSANTNTADKLKDYSTTQQMNSAIQQKADSITQAVAQTYASKNEVSNTYATKSELQQTSDVFNVKFTASGGYNLLKNGKATLNTDQWISNGGGISRVGDSVYGTCFQTEMPSGMRYAGGNPSTPHAVRLKNNTHYVFQAMVYSRTSQTGHGVTPLHFWCSTSHTTAGSSQCSILDYSQRTVAHRWEKCYVHFLTASSGEVWFSPFIYGLGNGTIWVTEIALIESMVHLPYSPHSNEIYDGITTVDKNGIRVSQSNVGTYTHMNANGFFVRKNDGHTLFEATNKVALYNGNGVSCVEIVNTPNANYGNARIDVRGGINFVHNPGQSTGINQILLGNHDVSNQYGYHNMFIRCHNTLGFADNYGWTHMFADTRRGRWIMKGAVYQNTATPPSVFSMNFDGEDEVYNSGFARSQVIDSIMDLKTGVYVDNDGQCCSAIYGGYNELLTAEYEDEDGYTTTHLNTQALTASLVVTCQEQQKLIESLQKELKEIKEHLKVAS